MGNIPIYPINRDKSREDIDDEINYIVKELYRQTRRLIELNLDLFLELAKLLLEKKTLRYDELLHYLVQRKT